MEFEKLKTALFGAGYDAISDFLGYDYPADEDKETTGNRIDEAYEQMPEEEFQKYLEAYGIH